MQDEIAEVEANMAVSREIRAKLDPLEKKKAKDESGPSGVVKDEKEQKIDEMTRMLRNLLNTIARMELEGRNPPR